MLGFVSNEFNYECGLHEYKLIVPFLSSAMHFFNLCHCYGLNEGKASSRGGVKHPSLPSSVMTEMV
jgi:hypothetical protein